MKQFLCLILSVLLLFSLIACTQKTENITEPANFYYCTPHEEYETNHNVISKEIREIVHCQKDINQILALYLSGPQSESLKTPFPPNTELISVVQEENMVVVVLSSAFSQLTGYDLNVASACICLTIFDLTAYSDVSIRCENILLDGNESIDFSREDILLSDEVFIQSDF